VAAHLHDSVMQTLALIQKDAVEPGEVAKLTRREVDVFVRDRGRGFELETVPADRLGVRNSIVDRMQRHGGAATVRSAPGDGTEVRLHTAPLGSRDDRGAR
jgi:signal transduction histidine kinase